MSLVEPCMRGITPAGFLEANSKRIGLGKKLTGDPEVTVLWGDYNLINFRYSIKDMATIHVNTDHNIDIETKHILEVKALLEANASLDLSAIASADFMRIGSLLNKLL